MDNPSHCLESPGIKTGLIWGCVVKWSRLIRISIGSSEVNGNCEVQLHPMWKLTTNISHQQTGTTTVLQSLTMVHLFDKLCNIKLLTDGNVKLPSMNEVQERMLSFQTATHQFDLHIVMDYMVLLHVPVIGGYSKVVTTNRFIQSCNVS